MMEELIALAAQQLDRVKAACSLTGLKYVELPPTVFGVGVAIGFGQTDYTILSILGGGSESQVMATSGILKNIAQERGPALEVANRFNQNNSSYSVYLHDAQAGWSLLVQRTTPVKVFLDCPDYLNAIVRALPMAVQEFRQTIAQETQLGGQPWTWTEQDHSDLLVRSML